MLPLKTTTLPNDNNLIGMVPVPTGTQQNILMKEGQGSTVLDPEKYPNNLPY
jgi:hypothetical protein